jgi:hypothetical protein
MSIEKGDFNAKERTRSILLANMPMQCLDCIDARMLVGKVVTIVESGDSKLADGLNNYSEFMTECTEGVQLVGTCGTARKVCQHPESKNMQNNAGDFFTEGTI